MPTSKLLSIRQESDIPLPIRNTAMGDLFRMHNLGLEPLTKTEVPELLIVTCMDYRINLHIKDRFAYIIRNGGANIYNEDFFVKFGVAVAHLKHIAIIGHTDCGMCKVRHQSLAISHHFEDTFQWSPNDSEVYIAQNSERFGLSDEAIFTYQEALFLQSELGENLAKVCPLMYNVEDNQLYLIGGYQKNTNSDSF